MRRKKIKKSQSLAIVKDALNNIRPLANKLNEAAEASCAGYKCLSKPGQPVFPQPFLVTYIAGAAVLWWRL